MEKLFVKSIISTCCKVNSIRLVSERYCKFSFSTKTTDTRNVIPQSVSLFNKKTENLVQYDCLKFHTSNLKHRDRNDYTYAHRKLLPKDEGTEGEKSENIAVPSIRGFGELFPDENTPHTTYDGVKFTDLPIVHIKATPNNTLMCFTNSKGKISIIRSCGCDGFKNAKKGTNVAAQVTGKTLGDKIVERGFKNIRVAVKGLGPGRVTAIKGLTLSGLNVVSLSDVTPISFTISPRPRKVRRI